MSNKATVARMDKNEFKLLILGDNGITAFATVESNDPRVVWVGEEVAAKVAQRFAAALRPDERIVYVPVLDLPVVTETEAQRREEAAFKAAQGL